MSTTPPSSEQQLQQHQLNQAAMEAALASDNLPQVSNLLRKLAQSSPHQQQQQQMPAKLGFSPLSLRERLLSGGDIGSSSLTAADSRTSSDMSGGPFESDLQSLWDLTGGAQQQQQLQQLQEYQGSPLNPNLNNSSNADMRQQIHLRQQLGLMAAALMPRSNTLGTAQPTDSQGSGEHRGKRRWAETLETTSLPSSTPGSPPRSGGPVTDNLAALLLEGASKKMETHEDKAGRELALRKDDPLEWEPRVRRKKGGKGGGGSDEEGAASDGGGGQRIKAKSMTERQRRDRISDALRRLRGAVNSHGDMATMLNEAVDVIQQQKRRIEELEMQILQQRLRQQLAGGCRTLF